jgi:hypothetical protein
MPPLQIGSVHRSHCRWPLTHGSHSPAHEKENTQKNDIQDQKEKTNSSNGDQKIGSHAISCNRVGDFRRAQVV